MTKHLDTLLLVLMALIACLTLWAAFVSVAECHTYGGTIVRGLVWLECIK